MDEIFHEDPDYVYWLCQGKSQTGILIGQNGPQYFEAVTAARHYIKHIKRQQDRLDRKEDERRYPKTLYK